MDNDNIIMMPDGEAHYSGGAPMGDTGAELGTLTMDDGCSAPCVAWPESGIYFYPAGWDWDGAATIDADAIADWDWCDTHGQQALLFPTAAGRLPMLPPWAR